MLALWSVDRSCSPKGTQRGGGGVGAHEGRRVGVEEARCQWPSAIEVPAGGHQGAGGHATAPGTVASCWREEAKVTTVETSFLLPTLV